MDHSSDLMSFPAGFHPSASASSSSFSRQRWSQLTPSHSSPVVDTAGPSHHAHPGRYESTTLDETTRAHRTTALRQLNGTPRSSPAWKSRTPNPPSSNGRSSALASQPVLVRSYSGGPDEPPESSRMPSRLFFPFLSGGGGSSSSSARRSEPQIPAEQDFSIDGILRAIEPDIRSTLDSIGEICGRSKLSLANEYGSHIAPLGEIRAPPGGLVTVEEASSDHERPANDNVVIYDDENSVADGREYISFPLYGYVEHVTQARAAAQPDTPRSTAFSTGVDPTDRLASPPVTRDFTANPPSSGRALLGRTGPSRGDDQTVPGVSTSAVVSEVLLDARASGPSDAPGPLAGPQDESFSSRVGNFNYNAMQNLWTSSSRPDSSVLTEVQALFGWLRSSVDGVDASRTEETAETRLRAMLERGNRDVDESH